MKRALVLVIVACAGSDDPVAPGLEARDPDATMRDVFAVLGRYDRAIRARDPAALATVYAPRYRELACGKERVLDPHAAATARITRGTGNGWSTALSNDGAMAWAITTGSPIIHLEVLERGDHGWHLSVGGVSTNGEEAGCDKTAAPTDEPERPLPELRDAKLATATGLIWCGWWGGDLKADEVRRYEAEVLKLDADHHGTLDFVAPGPSRAAMSRDRQMAWRIQGAPNGPQTLSVHVHARDGWEIQAALWSPDVGEDCSSLRGRGRVTVTDTSIEILDLVGFPWNSVEPQPEARPILDAIFVTLQGNPSIRRIAIRVNADPREKDPLALSEQRGLAVRAYLVRKGIAIDRLDVHFLGAAALAGGVRAEFEILQKATD